MDDFICKVIAAILTFLILIGVGGPILYFASYEIVNHVDVSIYNRYATSGKYEDNIFLSGQIEEETGIVTEIINKLDISGESVKRKQDIAKIICDNREDVSNILKHNVKYCKYLKDKGATIEEFFKWNERIAELDELIMQTSVFILCLIYAMLWILVFKWRKAFYLCAGIVYVIFTLSYFSGGITDYLLVNLANIFPGEIFGTVTYVGMEEFRAWFFSGFKESIVAFIIFDTLIQFIENRRTTELEQEINDLIYSIDYLILQLSNYTSNCSIYRSHIKIDIKNLKRLSRKKKSDEFKELIAYFTDDKFWNQYHTNTEYLLKLKAIREQIYKCNL